MRKHTWIHMVWRTIDFQIIPAKHPNRCCWNQYASETLRRTRCWNIKKYWNSLKMFIVQKMYLQKGTLKFFAGLDLETLKSNGIPSEILLVLKYRMEVFKRFETINSKLLIFRYTCAKNGLGFCWMQLSLWKKQYIFCQNCWYSIRRVRKNALEFGWM